MTFVFTIDNVSQQMIKEGIFASFRNKGINLLDNSFVNISSFDYWPKSDICEYICCKDGILGGPAQNIVDGLSTTGWSPLIQREENQYVIFAFNSAKIKVESIAIKTLCAPPQHVILQGSYDKGNSWFPICDIKQSVSEYSVMEGEF